MNTPYTPGPWFVMQNDHGNKITTSPTPQAGALFVCGALSGAHRPKAQEVANMRLCAAAPELLEALQILEEDAMSDCDADEDHAPKVTWEAVRKAQAAIAKALNG